MRFFVKPLFALLLIPFVVSAQFNCGNSIAQEKLFRLDPAARTRFENITKSKTAQNSTMAASYTIPVVFHVLHKGGTENITDAQLQSAIAILNRDYRKQNADTANIVSQFQGVAADCAIQFSLATIDPNGHCTNGITRHYDLNTDWTIDPADYLYTWPPSKYLNVYIVKSLPSGVAGYCYLPGTVGASMDAVVILSTYVGNIGTGSNYSSRALTHEVGHWLNLQHTWGSTNNPGVACGDDGVNDTPVTKGHSWCNLSNGVDCTPGVVENIQNYMEYSYCNNMFTQGQKTRMWNCLGSTVSGRNNVSSNTNLVATGVINPLAGCAPHPEFIPNSSVTCVGNGISFTDYSYNGIVTSWNWTSVYASNSSTVQNGSLTFTASGLAPVQLVAGNSSGSDSITKIVVTVLAPAGSGSVNVAQGFETGIFPNNKWIASQPSYGGPFLQTNTVGATGNSCVWVNNFYDNASGPVSFYSPAFNLTGMASPQLNFSYAYAQQSSVNNDQLKVYVSTDCGGTWSQVYAKSGPQLSTNGIPLSQAYSPSAGEWKNEMLSLQSFAGSTQVYLKFEFTPDVNGPGNNLFVDDINIQNVSGMNENNAQINLLAVYPNPFSEQVTITTNGLPVASVKVYDVSFRQMYEIIPANTAVQQITLEGMTRLSSGIYFLEIKSGAATKMIKLVKE